MGICKAPALWLKALCKKISYCKILKYQLVSFDSVFAVLWNNFLILWFLLILFLHFFGTVFLIFGGFASFSFLSWNVLVPIFFLRLFVFFHWKMCSLY